MLKDQYLQTIIGNLGIAISPENNSEIIIKLDVLYDKKSDVFTLSSEYKIFYQDYGTIITDFKIQIFQIKKILLSFSINIVYLD